MPRKVGEEGIEGITVGRPDYTKGVFSRSQPMVRRWQTRFSSFNADDTGTLIPGELFMGLQRPREVGYLMAMFDIFLTFNPALLMRSYIGVVQFDKFYYSSQTEADLLYYTIHGPFLEQWTYGSVGWHLLTPLTYVPEDEYEWFYIFSKPIHDEEIEVTWDYGMWWFDDVITD